MNNTTLYNTNVTRNISLGNKDSLDLLKRSRFAFAVVEGTLCPVIVLVNLVVIVAIVSNSSLRHNFRYLTIVSIAVADIIIGLVSCPVRSDLILKRRLNHGCATYLFISVFESYVQMFVGTWGVVSINTDFLLTLFQVNLPKVSELRKKIVQAFFIGLPWVVMCFIVLPIAVKNAGWVYISSRICRVNLKASARYGLIYLSYVVPSVLTVIQTVVMITMYFVKKRTKSASSSSATSPTWMLVSASLVTVLMVFGEQLVFLLDRSRLYKLGLNVVALLFFSTVAVSDAKSAVLPFLWFMCPNIRSSVMDLYNKLPWRRTVDVYKSDLTVDYKNLEEEGHA